MPWTLEGELTTEWTAATIHRPYVQSLYWLPDYVEDEEWSLSPEPDDEWVLAA